MVTIRLIERRGPVLTPSNLACLAGVSTVNVSAGCAHGCVYCYGRGYSQYPGDDRVTVYRDTAARVAKELARKRRRPAAIYFCPSCDAFQPLDAILEQSYQSMAAALETGADVEFVTKGAIPDRFIDLFRRHPGRVSGQVGLTTLDDGLHTMLEPRAASVAERLRNITRLKEAGVSVSVRADPLIHGVTDGDATLKALMDACRERGITVLAASYLFLRPAITAGLRRHLADRSLTERILAPYAQGVRFTLRGGAGGGLALPEATRRATYERWVRLGMERGLQVHVCGCKNPDLSGDRCHLVRPVEEIPASLLWDSLAAPPSPPSMPTTHFIVRGATGSPGR